MFARVLGFEARRMGRNFPTLFFGLAFPVMILNAVVAGASMAGLLAARVLSDHFGQVTLVERDRLACLPRPAKPDLPSAA